MSTTAQLEKMMPLEPSLTNSALGEDMQRFAAELFPICRSITGDGIRETLRRIGEHIPLTMHETISGTRVFDWTVPNEWNIRDAWVKNARGEKIVDFEKSNLHVLNYSVPVHKKVSLQELKQHLFTLPDHPDWIPYRTSYYKENWGFCITQRQYEQLEDGEYEVCIDSTLEPGSLTIGECFIPGETSDEILISCHACHPSLCNDNLSGISVATFLAKQLGEHSLRYSYRFLFVPGTIGSITWLALNEQKVANIKHGVVLTNVGDRGGSTYKRSRRGNAEIDQVWSHVLKHSGKDYRVIDFYPYGYDERQYCSPGFNLPVGCLMRSQHGTFPEYHTSADNLDFIAPESLQDTYQKCLTTFYVLENNRAFLNLSPKCEPQLGKRGIYRAIGGEMDSKAIEMAMFWVLNFSSGEFSLLEIADRADIEFRTIKAAADALLSCGLLREVSARKGSTG